MVERGDVPPCAAFAVRIRRSVSTVAEFAYEKCIIDGGGMFVNGHKLGGGAGTLAGSLPLAHSSAVRPAIGVAALGIARIAPSPVGIHGHAPEAILPAGGFLLSGQIIVRGAAVSVNVATKISGKNAAAGPIDIGAATAFYAGCGPDHDVVRPVIHGTVPIGAYGSDRPGNRVVVRDLVLVIDCIHRPALHHLAAGVVEAGDGFGLDFRLGKSGQEHTGQDGDDGDDHQKFDQRES